MTSSPPTSDAPLDPNDILIAEYNYIAQTAFQANEDRARVSNYYFVTAAAVIGAILSAKLEAGSAPGVYFGFAGMFAVLSLVGLTILLQLARLRTAWQDSARAMNVIKDFYIRHSASLTLEPAFLWRMTTIPQARTQGRNARTVSFLLAVSVLAISFGTTTAAMAYFLLALATSFKFGLGVGANFEIALVSLAAGAAYTWAELRVYDKWIAEEEDKQATRVEAHYARVQGLKPKDEG